MTGAIRYYDICLLWVSYIFQKHHRSDIRLSNSPLSFYSLYLPSVLLFMLVAPPLNEFFNASSYIVFASSLPRCLFNLLFYFYFILLFFSLGFPFYISRFPFMFFPYRSSFNIYFFRLSFYSFSFFFPLLLDHVFLFLLTAFLHSFFLLPSLFIFPSPKILLPLFLLLLFILHS
jgi:hypothetical protein